MSCAAERVLVVKLEERGRRACGGWASSGWAPWSFSVWGWGVLGQQSSCPEP